MVLKRFLSFAQLLFLFLNLIETLWDWDLSHQGAHVSINSQVVWLLGDPPLQFHSERQSDDRGQTLATHTRLFPTDDNVPFFKAQSLKCAQRVLTKLLNCISTPKTQSMLSAVVGKRQKQGNIGCLSDELTDWLTDWQTDRLADRQRRRVNQKTAAYATTRAHKGYLCLTTGTNTTLLASILQPRAATIATTG